MKALLRGRQYRKRKEVYDITLPKLEELAKTCDKGCMSLVYRRKKPSGLMAGGAYYAAVVRRDGPVM